MHEETRFVNSDLLTIKIALTDYHVTSLRTFRQGFLTCKVTIDSSNLTRFAIIEKSIGRTRNNKVYLKIHNGNWHLWHCILFFIFFQSGAKKNFTNNNLCKIGLNIPSNQFRSVSNMIEKEWLFVEKESF